VGLSIKHCNWPWFEAFIHVNGDVKPCCYATSPVGNLRDGTLNEIWLGERMEEVRDYIAADKLHPICVGASCVYVADQIDDSGNTGESYEERLRKMADSGSAWSAFSYGWYLVGEARANEGVPFLKSAATSGHPSAQYLLSTFLLYGTHGLQANVTEAIGLLRSSAAQKHMQAMYLLGDLLCAGQHAAQDIGQGTALLKEAGERGELAAWVRLAEVYSNDSAESRRYLEIGARRGSAEARAALDRLDAS
jgi:TPR repeat protein